MAASGVLVSCSGAVISSILYEQLRRNHAQEGFLLGEVESHISEHISDSQICNEKTETVINLSSFVPCTGLGSFYSGAGTLNHEKLTQYLGSNYKRVMGWYKCRGTNNCDDVYLRETLVHKQLEAAMAPHTGGHFLFALLSSRPSPDLATLTTIHKFMMYHNNQFECAPLRVVNIGDTSTSDYLLKPHNPSLYTSPAVKGVLHKIRQEEPGVAEVNEVHSGLMSQLECLLEKFGQAQDQYETILQEVLQLRAACASHSIKPNFIPEEYQESEEVDLMNFESPQPSPTKTSKETRRGRGVGRRLGRGRGLGRGKEKDSNSTDLFGFVNTEMEKLQVRTGKQGVGSGSDSGTSPGPGAGSRSRSNTPSPRRILQKSRSAGGSLQRTPPRRSSESECSADVSPSPVLKRNQDSRGTHSASPAREAHSGSNRVTPKGRGRPQSSRSPTKSPSPGPGQSVGKRGGRGKARRGQSVSSSQEY